MASEVEAEASSSSATQEDSQAKAATPTATTLSPSSALGPGRRPSASEAPSDDEESSAAHGGATSAGDDDPGAAGGGGGGGAAKGHAASASPAPLSGAADWTQEATPADHIFVATSSSADSCYLSSDCRLSSSSASLSSARLKCVSCRAIAHADCLDALKARFPCRTTFRDDVRKYREQTSVQHHWVQRKNLKGRCKHCSKTFQSMLGFGSSKEVLGTNCSWCKVAYHAKDACLRAKEADDECDLGANAAIIVPPSWIVKLPTQGNFKSSLKNSPNKNKRKQQQKTALLQQQESIGGAGSGGSICPNTPTPARPFCIKPAPSDVGPVLVFLNPKSGGNQGVKLMQKFQWLLNPRQVFDLTKGGPQPAIEMFKKVPKVKLLACGGDGTVGWLLSVLDKVLDKSETPPAVSVLPLGTGNDLSRSLGWGGGYMDEPISKILNGLQSADEVKLDRWQLKVNRNSVYPATDEKGQDGLPLSVVNNYFSLGVDAQIALQFHEAREANPHKFNSRIRNKMFYGQAGGKDLLLRKWKDLSEEVEVECDGQDITAKLRKHGVHSVLFANIPSFGSGTRPWDPARGEQKVDDGLIEVIGLTTYQMPLLQAGSHGTCITQCRTAVIRTRKTIPMQVDGEAARVNPAVIELSLLNQVPILAKRKGDGKSRVRYKDPERSLLVRVCQIHMRHYELHHCDKAKLRDLSSFLCEVEAPGDADLEQVRKLINKSRPPMSCPPSAIPATAAAAASITSPSGSSSQPQELPASPEWTFTDAVTAVRFFRIDRAQESLHYVTDICDVAVEEATGRGCCTLYVVYDDDFEDDAVDLDRSPLRQVASNPAPQKSNLLTVAASRSPKEPQSPTSVSNGGRRVDGDDEPDVMEGKVIKNNNNLMLEDQQHGVAAAGGGHAAAPPAHFASSAPPPSPAERQAMEKTTEGVLKAARLGDIKMLMDLHAAEYSLLSIDETGKTALHYGARFGHKEVVKFLIANAPPAILDMADNEKGQTALHKAANYKRRTICCYLVAAGASLLLPDAAGLLPRQLAAIAEDSDLAAYLQSQEDFQRERAEGIELEEGTETPV